jgi:hypothetical protein
LVGHDDRTRLTRISQVGLRFLSSLQKLLLEALTKHHEIVQEARLERTVDPDDITGTDAGADFVTERGTLKLLRVPLLRRILLLQSIVSAVHTGLATEANVSSKSVAPANLLV